MNSIDKLTLELLMNRSLWSKNTDQHDIFKTEEQNEMKQKQTKYKIRILQMFNKYLEDPDFHTNNEMDEIFEIYIKKNINYFEMNDLAVERFYETEYGDSEDIMFDTANMDDISTSSPKNIMHSDSNLEIDSHTNFSCWSNDRVKKMPTKYTMDMYVKSSL